MLTYSNEDLEKIKHLIAEGLNEEAINALYPIVVGNDELEDTVVMLKNRLATLQKSVREGTIDWDEANVERNLINRALLDTLNLLEDWKETPKNTLTTVPPKEEKPIKTGTPSVPSKSKEDKKTLLPSQILVRGLLALATILATVLIERSLNRWIEDDPTTLSSQDLTLKFVLRPDYPGLQQRGKAKVVIGDFTTPSQPIEPEGTIFAGIPAEYSDDSVKVILEEAKYPAKVMGLSAYNLKKSTDITAYIELKTNTYIGKVLRPSLKPAAGVEVNIENGLARDTTDAEGNFMLVVPLNDGQTVQLVLRRLGEAPKLTQRIGLSANILRQLKIPD